MEESVNHVVKKLLNSLKINMVNIQHQPDGPILNINMMMMMREEI